MIKLPSAELPRRAACLAFVSVTLLFAGCASVPDALAPRPVAVEPAKQVAATANPLATRAALRMLHQGGSPIDAAIAAQMVLGLVEPQSSGVGGGTLVMYWDQRARKLSAFDGLASAPAIATAALEVDTDGRRLPSAEVSRGGRSAGVPGTLAVLKQVHERQGRLAWAALFEPAIELAEGGFPMPAYLHRVLSQPSAAADHPDMRTLFFDPAGAVLPVGTKVVNPAYAATLRRIAATGPQALWQADAGAAVVASLHRGPHPSLITPGDLAAYRSHEREPVCAPFLVYRVCAMSPPSFGGVVVLQVLQMLQSRPAGANRFDFADADFVHFYAEAGRLAQADRLQYIGDPDFIAVPTAALVAPAYVSGRAKAIDTARAASRVEAGRVDGKAAAAPAPFYATSDATSQLAIVDGEGNALSMTTTINLNFGSRLMANGFVLNNAMTNFAGPGSPNRMQGNKRPVTSMAPVVVFDASGQPVVVGGSAGGGQIVDYIAQSLVEMLANGKTPAEALAQGHVSTAVRGKLELEQGTPRAALAPALAAKGHDVAVVPLPSGIGFLKRSGAGWIGAADPRRDGVALGE